MSTNSSNTASAQVLGIHVGLLAIGFLSFALATSAHPPVDHTVPCNASTSSVPSTEPTKSLPTTFSTSYISLPTPSQVPAYTIEQVPAESTPRNLKIRGRNITEVIAQKLALEQKDYQEAGEIASGQLDPRVKPAMDKASRSPGLIAVYVIAGILMLLLAALVVWVIKRSMVKR